MKILLAYDGFKHSENALAAVADLAGAPGTEITILSVVPPDARASKSGGHVGLRPHSHEDVARAHAYLRERGIESTMQMENGDPASEIARVAEEGSYDLVVAGSRGRSPVGELLLGSVSQAVVRQASCPVLVVTKDAQQRFEPTSPV
ncbi:MAG TPA: universal stress protein [Gaiellaceae bacterium]|nr:universal stress protein [Gaiellaceae bacterium]